MRQALCKAVTVDDIRVLTATMLAKARDGDMAATKLLLLYAVGRPTEAVDPDTLDHEEWALFKRYALTEDYLEITRRLPPWHLCTLFRAASPELADGWTHMLADRFREHPPQATAKTAGNASTRR